MLPIEVRLLIWEAVDTPYDQSQIHSIRGFPLHVLKVNHPEVNVLERDVTFTAEREWFQQGLSSFHCTFGVIFMSTTAAPIHPVLHACSESRMHIIKKRGLEYAFHTLVLIEGP